MKTITMTPILITIVAALLTLTPERSAVAADTVQVRPGSVVRWYGVGTSSCSLLERTWGPIDDTCWFPIDLLLPEGELTLGRQRQGRHESTTVRVGPYPYPVQQLQVDDSKVHLSAADLARHGAEVARVRSLWSLESVRRFSLPLAAPLVPTPTPASFGNLRVFNGEPRSPHSGVDLSAPRGTSVLAMAAGTVVLAEEHFFSGNSVYIDHGDGLISMSFHLDRIAVTQGQQVSRGQQIGTVGATGRVTGPHLHLGLRWHGARIDPTLLLSDPGPPARPVDSRESTVESFPRPH